MTVVLQGPMAKLLETRPHARCALCNATLQTFKSPMNACKAIQRVELTIVGEYQATKKDVATTNRVQSDEVDMESVPQPRASNVGNNKKQIVDGN